MQSGAIDRIDDKAVGEPKPILRPVANPRIAMFASVCLALAIALAGIAVHDDRSTAPSDPIMLSSRASAGVIVTANMDFANHPEAMSRFLMDAPEKAKLRSDIAAGRVRVGMLRVWDSVDEDNDRVRIEGAGYRQDVRLKHTPQTFLVPFTPGGVVTIVALGDGGGGGVTLGVSSVLGPTILPPLASGQSVGIPVL